MEEPFFRNVNIMMVINLLKGKYWTNFEFERATDNPFNFPRLLAREARTMCIMNKVLIYINKQGHECEFIATFLIGFRSKALYLVFPA